MRAREVLIAINTIKPAGSLFVEAIMSRTYDRVLALATDLAMALDDLWEARDSGLVVLSEAQIDTLDDQILTCSTHEGLASPEMFRGA